MEPIHCDECGLTSRIFHNDTNKPSDSKGRTIVTRRSQTRIVGVVSCVKIVLLLFLISNFAVFLVNAKDESEESESSDENHKEKSRPKWFGPNPNRPKIEKELRPEGLGPGRFKPSMNSLSKSSKNFLKVVWIKQNQEKTTMTVKLTFKPEKKIPDKEHIISKDAYGHLLQGQKLIEVDAGFIHAFVASLSVIIVSELGDKTFFIAAIMAMRHPRLVVFGGAIGALVLMTILSALLGYATTVIPRWFTYYASSALFAIFGIKMLREGYLMSADEGKEEYDEVQTDLSKRDEELESDSSKDVETGIIRTPQRRILYMFFSRIFLQSFTLTFLAEWGDRSQISTIILAARQEVIGVILGGSLGHALCTGLAVLGGRFVAQRISIRAVTLIGGVVFIIFALSAFVIEPDD